MNLIDLKIKIMNEHTVKTKPGIQPSDKKIENLQFSKDLKERGMWPPRLHNGRDKDRSNDRKPTATPFLVIPAISGDNGSRPIPNSQAFHSQAISIEDSLGNLITSPS